MSGRDLGKSPGGVCVDLGFGDVKYKYEESQDVPESGVSDHEKVVGRFCKHSISGFFKMLNKCRNIIDHPETSLPSNITFEKPFNTHEQPDAGQGCIG